MSYFYICDKCGCMEWEETNNHTICYSIEELPNGDFDTLEGEIYDGDDTIVICEGCRSDYMTYLDIEDTKKTYGEDIMKKLKLMKETKRMKWLNKHKILEEL